MKSDVSIVDDSGQANAKPSRRPSLLVNAMSNWAALAANLLVGFLITPFIILKIGTDGFGIYDLVVIIIGYSGLLDLGVTSALMHYAARYAGQRDEESLKCVVNTALAGFAGLGLFVFAVASLGAGAIAAFFKVQPDNLEVFRTVLRLFGLSAGLTFPGTVLSVFMLAHERYVLSNTVKIVAATMRGFLSYKVLGMGMGLVGLSWVFVITSFTILLLNFTLVRLFIPSVRFGIRAVSLSTARDLFTFGFFTFIYKGGDILRFRMGQAVIKMFMGFEMVGLYGLGAMLFKNVMKVTIACSGVTHPRLSSLAGRDMNVFRHAFLRYATVTSVFASIVGATAFLLAPDFLRVWLPARISDGEVRLVTTITFILLGGFLPDVMTNVSINGLQAVRRHQFLAYQTAAEGVVNLCLAVIMVQIYGIVGIAMAAAIPALVTKIIIQPIYTSKILGVSWRQYFFRVLLRPVVVMSLAGLMVLILERTTGHLFDAKTYLGVAAKAVFVFVTMAAAGFLLCLDSDFRKSAAQHVLELVTAFWRPLRPDVGVGRHARM